MRKGTRRKKGMGKIIIIEVIILVLVIGAYIFVKNSNLFENNENPGKVVAGDSDKGTTTPEVTLTPEEIEQQRIEAEQKKLQEEITAIKAEADLFAMQYDYDAAMEKIKSFSGNYLEQEELAKAYSDYEATKQTLVPLGAYNSVDQINHIFFHSLIADTDLAFDGDYDSNGYNYYMTTISEFIAMMEQMYEDGYVLVSIHDVAKEVTLEDGTKKFVPGDILLPPDKKPFVLSQDDVNYYDYMDGDGFASRIVIDENGRPSTEMILSDGNTVVGDYDMVPVLETFLETHPDFSYKGARGILALTGYEGALGYRTDDKTSPTYEQDKETVKEVAKVLKEWGWEFASHSWGHRNMGTSSYNFIVKDTTRWLEEVGSLIGPTDILIYPYGIEIENTIGNYKSDKYEYLKSVGFNYYCGVYKAPWIHVKDDYVRMTRRPLDGQAMLEFPERLEDLFDLSTIIDKSRPALIK